MSSSRYINTIFPLKTFDKFTYTVNISVISQIFPAAWLPRNMLYHTARSGQSWGHQNGLVWYINMHQIDSFRILYQHCIVTKREILNWIFNALRPIKKSSLPPVLPSHCHCLLLSSLEFCLHCVPVEARQKFRHIWIEYISAAHTILATLITIYNFLHQTLLSRRSVVTSDLWYRDICSTLVT